METIDGKITEEEFKKANPIECLERVICKKLDSLNTDIQNENNHSKAVFVMGIKFAYHDVLKIVKELKTK